MPSGDPEHFYIVIIFITTENAKNFVNIDYRFIQPQLFQSFTSQMPKIQT